MHHALAMEPTAGGRLEAHGAAVTVVGRRGGLATDTVLDLLERNDVPHRWVDVSRIENYPGFPDGVSGEELADRAHRQARRFGAEFLVGVEARRGARPRPAEPQRLASSNTCW